MVNVISRRVHTCPDGSKRKEIKIPSGCKAPEDVEVYKNRTAKWWKNRGNHDRVLGAEGLDGAVKGSGTGTITGNTKKTAKRREAEKKAMEHGTKAARNLTAANPKSSLSNRLNSDPEAEKAKNIHTLKKRPRQAREWREKKDNGDHFLPE